ncbi:hypothetical protein NQ317_016931, partial [Molorchus minor]
MIKEQKQNFALVCCSHDVICVPMLPKSMHILWSNHKKWRIQSLLVNIISRALFSEIRERVLMRKEREETSKTNKKKG